LRRFPPSAREMPLSPAPSAPAVLPGFDGLLRCAPRRVRAFGVRAQLALNPLPSAFLLQPTLGFMPFRLLLPVRALSIRPGAFRRPVRKNREVASCVCRSVPVMPYPSKRSPRQQPSRRHRPAIPSRRYRSLRWSSSRLRTAAPTPLAAAGLKALLRCRSPGAESLLPAVLSRCSPGLHPEEGGWKMLPRRLSGQAAQSRDRNRSPGRTRVHPVYRPRSDLDDGATSPRLIRWILWGSVYPEEDLATALRRAGRAGSVRRHGVATPHLDQRAAKQPAEPRWPKIAFSFPYVTGMRCLPDSHRPLEPQGFAR
jgi:hypothetical protein